MPDKHKTEEMQIVQRELAEQESELAGEASETAEQRTHERRADKAAYLAEKLSEQRRARDAPSPAPPDE
jgi:hypothetical protein